MISSSGDGLADNTDALQKALEDSAETKRVVYLPAGSAMLHTAAGGRSEVIGVHNYNTQGAKDDTPFFRVDDASLSVAGYREVHFGGAWWKVPVRATRDGQAHDEPQHPWNTWSLLRTGP